MDLDVRAFLGKRKAAEEIDTIVPAIGKIVRQYKWGIRRH